MTKLLTLLAREPVLLGAAAIASAEAAFPDASPLAKLAWGAWVAYFQRLFSTSNQSATKKVADATEAGYNSAVADVSALAVAADPPAKPKARRSR